MNNFTSNILSGFNIPYKNNRPDILSLIKRFKIFNSYLFRYFLPKLKNKILDFYQNQQQILDKWLDDNWEYCSIIINKEHDIENKKRKKLVLIEMLQIYIENNENEINNYLIESKSSRNNSRMIGFFLKHKLDFISNYQMTEITNLINEILNEMSTSSLDNFRFKAEAQEIKRIVSFRNGLFENVQFELQEIKNFLR